MALACAVVALSPNASAQIGARTDIAVVVEVAPAPIVGPDGRPPAGAAETLARLTEAFGSLERIGIPFALSVSPVLVSELRLLGPTGARPYAALLRLASSVPVLTRPFADVRLPHLPDTDAVAEQLRMGTSVLTQSLGVEPSSVVHPPGLELNAEAVGLALQEGYPFLLAPSEDLRGRAVRVDGVTLLPALRISPAEAPIDEALADLRAPRVIVADALDPRLGEVGALSSDARFNIVAVTGIAPAPPDSTVRFDTGPRPPAAYTEAVAGATESLEAFASYTLEENPVRQTLDVVLGIATSSVHWLDRWDEARDLAALVVDRVSEERDLVFASQGSVTLTSQRGTVPVTVINLARYPVRVRVHVSSPRLSFPEGETRVLVASPQGDTITFVAQATAPGTFPMAIDVTSPDGAVSFGSSEVLVRSIAARTPALVLTVGAALFLLAWSARSLLRRRRSRARRRAD